MPKKKSITLKDEVLDLALEIADRLDFGCSVYEERVYTEWNKLIEENRRSEFIESLKRERKYTSAKLIEHPRFLEVGSNPFTKVYRLINEFEKRMK